MRKRRSILRFASSSVALLAVLLGAAGLATAAKKPGGGAVPPGRIYFGRLHLQDSGYPPSWENLGVWNMLGDGGYKQASPNFPTGGEPSRRLHPDRWILQTVEIPEADGGALFPNGQPQQDFYAVRESDGLAIRLTNDPHVASNSNVRIQVDYGFGRRWAHDDSFFSFAAVTWTPVAEGGNFLDGKGRQWLVDAGIFVAAVEWIEGAPLLVGSPALVLDAGLYWESGGALETFYARPDILHLDWSPAADHVVWEHITQDLETGREYRNLFCTRFDADGFPLGTIPLGLGRSPEWSPDGARIAYWRYDADAANVWVANPDGSGAAQLTSGGTGGPDSNPKWSPDSTHLAFTRPFHNRRRGASGPYTITTYSVMRVPAAGGTVVNLTNDLDGDSAGAVGWR